MKSNLIIIVKKLYLISIATSSYFFWQYNVNACGQSPDPSGYQTNDHSHLNGVLQLDQEPIKPIFVEHQLMRSNSVSVESNSENEKDDPISAAVAAVSTKISENGHDLANIVKNPIQDISNKINHFKNNFTEEARLSISNALHNIGQSALTKLNDSELFVSEKFRPIVEFAIKIFNTPGTSEKDRWNKLVERVESTNLSDSDKRKFYQKVVNATLI